MSRFQNDAQCARHQRFNLTGRRLDRAAALQSLKYFGFALIGVLMLRRYGFATPPTPKHGAKVRHRNQRLIMRLSGHFRGESQRRTRRRPDRHQPCCLAYAIISCSSWAHARPPASRLRSGEEAANEIEALDAEECARGIFDGEARPHRVEWIRPNRKGIVARPSTVE